MAAPPQQRPWQYTFYVQITPITTSGGQDSRRSDGWQPPRGNGQNIPAGHPLSFHYDGHQMRYIAGVPAGVRPFRDTVSMYIYQAIIFGIQQDATRGPVPLHDSTGPSWRRMGFNYRAGCASYVTFAGRYARLAGRTANRSQPWIEQLLPDGYQPFGPPLQNSNGGMIGDLNVIIGLMAFSVPLNELVASLQVCFNRGNWVGHNMARGRGWQDRRGLMVQVFWDPRMSNIYALQQMEGGSFGPLLF